MRRYIAPLAATAIACGLPLAVVGPASAFGAETLGCYVSAGAPLPFTTPDCSSATPGHNYAVRFALANESGSYTFAWTIPSHIRGLTGQSGCTSTSDTCSFAVTPGGGDIDIPVSVVVTQAGQSETLYADATVLAVCGNEFC